MARRQIIDDEVKHDRWLISYADFITLLFAFFVVMYSLSHMKGVQYEQLTDQFAAAFKQAGQDVPALFASDSAAPGNVTSDENTGSALVERNAPPEVDKPGAVASEPLLTHLGELVQRADWLPEGGDADRQVYEMALDQNQLGELIASLHPELLGDSFSDVSSQDDWHLQLVKGRAARNSPQSSEESQSSAMSSVEDDNPEGALTIENQPRQPVETPIPEIRGVQVIKRADGSLLFISE